MIRKLFNWRMIILLGSIAILLIAIGIGIGFWIKNTPSSEIAGVTGSPSADSHDHKGHPIYTCPMHPTIVSDKPAKCPICGMDLQKIETESKERKIVFYRHPMRPEITSPVPAKDEMGMDYTPVYEDETKTDSLEVEVSGRAAFNLSQQRQQLIGVTSEEVREKPLRIEVRAAGKVAFDPELFTAIEEYRQAQTTTFQMQAGGNTNLIGHSSELVNSAKTKLRLLGLTERQIKTLGAGRSAAMNLLLPEGNAWIYAEVFEYELPVIREGQNVTVTTSSLPGEMFVGKITSISPTVNSQTRTARIRAYVPDPKGLLRPDSFVNVRVNVDLGNKIALPSEAVLFNGDQSFVFLMKDQTKFQPQLVKLGLRAGNFYEVISGVKAGDIVVTSANFLIDSEARLRGVLKAAGGAEGQKP